MTATVQVHPIASAQGSAMAAMVGASGDGPWMLFLPEGGPLWLAPDIRVPARILFDRGFVVLDLASGVGATLHGVALPPGADVELLVGDDIRLTGAPLQLEVLA
jgi:hypothetical protein